VCVSLSLTLYLSLTHSCSVTLSAYSIYKWFKFVQCNAILEKKRFQFLIISLIFGLLPKVMFQIILCLRVTVKIFYCWQPKALKWHSI
jgi:hypothetical protein